MENEPLEIQSDIYVWDEDDYTGENAKQWLNFIYSFIPAGMDRFNGQPMEVLTDDAIPTDRANANWSVINSGYSTTNMFPLEHRKADTYGEVGHCFTRQFVIVIYFCRIMRKCLGRIGKRHLITPMRLVL